LGTRRDGRRGVETLCVLKTFQGETEVFSAAGQQFVVCHYAGALVKRYLGPYRGGHSVRQFIDATRQFRRDGLDLIVDVSADGMEVDGRRQRPPCGAGVRKIRCRHGVTTWTSTSGVGE